MSLLVDTNILVYAVNTDDPRHRAARSFFDERRRGEGFFLTWSILYEWLRIVTHRRVFRRPLEPAKAAAMVLKLIDSPKIDLLVETPHHGRFLEQTLADLPALRGNLYHDVHIATVMREHGLSRIATADRHFRLFPFLKVIDPTV